MIPIPRIRGRVGQAALDEAPEVAGKWFYEVSVWDFSGEELIYGPIQFGPHATEAYACEIGRAKVRELSEILEKEFTGATSGKFLDMKAGGILRPWENHS